MNSLNAMEQTRMLRRGYALIEKIESLLEKIEAQAIKNTEELTKKAA